MTQMTRPRAPFEFAGTAVSLAGALGFQSQANALSRQVTDGVGRGAKRSAREKECLQVELLAKQPPY